MYCRWLQVIVGDHALGDSTMLRPPPKDAADPHPLGDMYDFNDVEDSSTFVVFERWHAYPEYLIEF